MKLKLDDGVDVKVHLDIPIEELDDLVEKITACVLIVIVTATVCRAVA